ncbi:DNA-methyltransferase [Paenibacillus ehimensis]|uniref:Methyltransferase n=1 Tax=Paenibacillus ehimensis TaxID=79264 RepID=A0ABT8VFQ6_9BACL|nr:site-specific DNA-methyltransferase [Paenibacillus ehimensis]MDO3679812.1 site-specific DNA-methyltransferase [Paenibacillus ehimensis]
MEQTQVQRKLESLENSFICGNCEDVLKVFPQECIDLVLTSPPYADQRDYGSDDSLISPDQYVQWFAPKAQEIHRVLKENGSFVLNISDKVVNGYQHLFVFELVLFLCKDIGFHLVRDYIWYNPATPPNVFSRGGYGRTKKSHEYCFWFSKGPEWTFNLDPIRKPYGKDMLKYLQGKGKGDRNRNTRPSTHNFDCEKVWNDNGGSDPGSVIEIGNTNSNDVFAKLCKERGISHPARFPEKLAEFFILSGTDEGDIVLDPFSGSGTTAISAARNNRRWIGIDANQDYCELASARMNLEFEGASNGD